MSNNAGGVLEERYGWRWDGRDEFGNRRIVIFERREGMRDKEHAVLGVPDGEVASRTSHADNVVKQLNERAEQK